MWDDIETWTLERAAKELRCDRKVVSNWLDQKMIVGEPSPRQGVSGKLLPGYVKQLKAGLALKGYPRDQASSKYNGLSKELIDQAMSEQYEALSAEIEKSNARIEAACRSSDPIGVLQGQESEERSSENRKYSWLTEVSIRDYAPELEDAPGADMSLVDAAMVISISPQKLLVELQRQNIWRYRNGFLRDDVLKLGIRMGGFVVGVSFLESQKFAEEVEPGVFEDALDVHSVSINGINIFPNSTNSTIALIETHFFWRDKLLSYLGNLNIPMPDGLGAILERAQRIMEVPQIGSEEIGDSENPTEETDLQMQFMKSWSEKPEEE